MTTTKNIFVNLPVKDLDRSKNFFMELGFSFNPQFTDQNAACMVMGEGIYSMLVTEEFFKRFTRKEIADAHNTTECANCISAESREQVDALTAKALSLGATENIVPDMQQGEYMYGRSWNDLDGHIWEIMWMDPKIIQKQ